jgi:hypothetical protein
MASYLLLTSAPDVRLTLSPQHHTLKRSWQRLDIHRQEKQELQAGYDQILREIWKKATIDIN